MLKEMDITQRFAKIILATLGPCYNVLVAIKIQH